MNPWTCAALIAFAGSLGGVVNALLSDYGFYSSAEQTWNLVPGSPREHLRGRIRRIEFMVLLWIWRRHRLGAGHRRSVCGFQR